MKIQVLGCGCSLPQRVLTNADLEAILDTSDEWILERTGIRERRIKGPEQTVSSMAVEAAREALADAGIQGSEIDMIVVATVTPDMAFPSAACLVQAELGAQKAFAFDISAGCTGFIYGLTIAERFLKASPDMKYALIIGAEALSTITDYTDRGTAVLFGDGAGAVIVGRGSGGFGIEASYIRADGTGSDLLRLPAGGSLNPASEVTVREHLHFIKMNGNEVFRWASKVVPSVCEELLSRAGMSAADVDLFVPHQANLRIIKAALRYLDIPAEKTVITLDRFGNNSSASIPMALALKNREGLIRPGDRILAVAFGAGLTYGGVLFTWGHDGEPDLSNKE